MELKKIIAFDLDGTLTESKQIMTPGMAKLLDALSVKTKIVIISGGSYKRFKEQFIPQLVANAEAKNLENIILLPTSGSCRYEYSSKINDWTQVYSHPFKQEIKNRVMAELDNMITNHKRDFDIPEKHYGPYIEDRGNEITFSALGQESPLEVKGSWDSNGNKRLKIAKALMEAIPEIAAHLGGMTSVDILPKGFDKAVGLKILLKAENLTTADMLFIGDSIFEGGNDYSPIQAGIETRGIKGPEETAALISTFL